MVPGSWQKSAHGRVNNFSDDFESSGGAKVVFCVGLTLLNVHRDVEILPDKVIEDLPKTKKSIIVVNIVLFFKSEVDQILKYC